MELSFIQGEQGPIRLRAKSSATFARQRVATSTDGVARFDVPTPPSGEIRLIRIFPQYLRGYHSCGALDYTRLEALMARGIVGGVDYCPYPYSLR